MSYNLSCMVLRNNNMMCVCVGGGGGGGGGGLPLYNEWFITTYGIVSTKRDLTHVFQDFHYFILFYNLEV